MDESEIYTELGRLVRQHRERHGMSQETLAQFIDLSRASVANIETGRQRIPLHHLYGLAEALKVEPDALLPRAAKVVAGDGDRQIKASVNLTKREEANVARVLEEILPPTRGT
jgi:transcriptional regulator with XRE-family HTH domain